MRQLERVLDVAFKMLGSIPTWQSSHEGRIRWNPSTKRVAVGTDSAWLDMSTRNDPLRTKGTIPTITHEVTNMGSTSTVTVGTNSNSYSGSLRIQTAGTGYGSGRYFTVTFPVALADTNYDVFVQPLTDDAIALGLLRLTGQAVGSFGMLGLVTPQVSKDYRWSYLVVPRE